MSVIKNWKCVGDKNAALEHCWGVIAAKDRRIAALREALRWYNENCPTPFNKRAREAVRARKGYRPPSNAELNEILEAKGYAPASASPTSDPAEAMRAKWPPPDCRKPSSCDRNGACMYVPCIHAGQSRAALKGNGEGL